MIIPARFKLFNQTIKVIYKRNLIDTKEAIGICDFNKNTIYLQQSTRQHILTKEQIHQCFFHELFHMVLYLLSYKELSEDEALMDRLGMAMHQIIEQISND